MVTKILYDHQIFIYQEFGGISRYFYELMSAFEKDEDVRFDLSLAYSNNQYINNARFVKSRPFFKNRNFRFKNRLLHYLNMRGERKLLRGKDYDVFHPTYFNPYFLDYLGNKPFVLTIYDMVYELFPQIFSHRDKIGVYKKLLAPKATKIIAISENTKHDIIKLFGIKEDKIEVIYLANSLAAGTLEKGKGVAGDLPPKYLLFVGNRRVYKNFDLFVESISSLLKDDNGLHLVCAGGGKFTASEIAGLEKSGIMKKVTQRSFDDNKLAQFYLNALALVFPSLYEGFGIPVLEAFSCGCPVIVSNISSLPEVAGNAAAYFDPADKMSIVSTVKKVICNDDLRQELKARGYERLKEFSWEKTATDTKKLYQGIL